MWLVSFCDIKHLSFPNAFVGNLKLRAQRAPVRRSLGEGGKQSICFIVLLAFLFNSIAPLPQAHASAMPVLPAVGSRLALSAHFTPAQLRGITVDPKNPLRFEFLIERGHQPLVGQEQKDEYQKLVKYFLATLTTPEDNLWVNLSPYEKNRIIEDNFGLTEMGRDMLAQDYILKQLTASLIYPEEGIGKEFWDKVYKRAYEQFGTTTIPVNTFNKVWIVPQEAAIYEQGNSAYIVKSHLKVMLEEDYLAMGKNLSSPNVFPPKADQPLADIGDLKNGNVADSRHKHSGVTDVSALGSQVVREVVLPALEKEVNEGKNFAQLRQIFSAMILAEWYKRSIKNSLLSKVYVNQQKIRGISLSFPKSSVGNPDTTHIYQQYLQAFKKGAYNYIKEDYDQYSKQVIPRKYFSGGVKAGAQQWAMAMTTASRAQASDSLAQVMNGMDNAMINLNPNNRLGDAAMVEPKEKQPWHGVLADFKDKEQQLREFLVNHIFDDMNNAIAKRTSHSSGINSRVTTTPFLFPQHDFRLRNDSIGGIKMFVLLRDMINVLFQDRWQGQFKSPGAELQENSFTIQDLESFVKEGAIEGVVGLKRMKDFLRSKGFGLDVAGDVVINQLAEMVEESWVVESDGVRSLNKESVPKGGYVEKFIRVAKGFGITQQDDIEGITWVEIQRIINFLHSLLLINDEERGLLQDHCRKLITMIKELKAIPNINSGFTDEDNNPVIHKDREELRLVLQARERAAGRLAQDQEYNLDTLIFDYYDHTKPIYTVLSNVFLRLGEEIHLAIYKPVTSLPAGVKGVNGFELVRLQEGFYKDRTNFFGYRSPGSADKEVMQIQGDSLEEMVANFKKSPTSMMDVFIFAAQTQAIPSERVLMAMRQVIADTKNPVNWPAIQEKLDAKFEALVRVRQGISFNLLSMYEIGLLAKTRPQLASKDRTFDEYFHRYPITQHTILTLYFLEHGLEDLLSLKQTKDVPALIEARNLYQGIEQQENSSDLYVLRETLLRHDAQKPLKPQMGQSPHALAAAQEAYKGVSGTAEERRLIGWFSWHHGLLSALARSAAKDTSREAKPYASDLLYVADSTQRSRINAQLWKLLFLVTVADGNAVDPRTSKVYVKERDAIIKYALYRTIAEFKQASSKREQMAAWVRMADTEDEVLRVSISKELKAALLAEMKNSESDSSITGVKKIKKILKLAPQSDDLIIQELIETLQEGDVMVDARKSGSGFDALFASYISMFPIQYLRELNHRELVEQFLMYVFLDKYKGSRALAAVGSQTTSDGRMYDIVVGVKERRLILQKCTGLLAAIGFNIQDPVIYTSLVSNIVFDHFNGYFVDQNPQQHLDRMLPGIKLLLKKHKIRIPQELKITKDRKQVIWDDVLPVLLRAVFQRSGFLEDMFQLTGVLQSFDKVNTKSKGRSEVRIEAVAGKSRKKAYTIDFATDDRTGMLFTMSSLIGEGLEGNIFIKDSGNISRTELRINDTFSFTTSRLLDEAQQRAIEETTRKLLDKDSITLEELRMVVGQFKEGKYAVDISAAMTTSQLDMSKPLSVIANQLMGLVEGQIGIIDAYVQAQGDEAKKQAAFAATFQIIDLISELLANPKTEPLGVLINQGGLTLPGSKSLVLYEGKAKVREKDEGDFLAWELKNSVGTINMAIQLSMITDNHFNSLSLRWTNIKHILTQMTDSPAVVMLSVGKMAIDPRQFNNSAMTTKLDMSQPLRVIAGQFKNLVDEQIEIIFFNWRQLEGRVLTGQEAQIINMQTAISVIRGMVNELLANGQTKPLGIVFSKGGLGLEEWGDLIFDGKKVMLVDEVPDVEQFKAWELINAINIITMNIGTIGFLDNEEVIKGIISGVDFLRIRKPNIVGLLTKMEGFTGEIKFVTLKGNSIAIDPRIFYDSASTSDSPGGIDFNPTGMDMKVDRAQGSSPAVFDFNGMDLSKVDGFTPVIISITPVTSLPFLN